MLKYLTFEHVTKAFNCGMEPMYGRGPQRPKLQWLKSVSALVLLNLSTKGHNLLESQGEITSQTGRQSLYCSLSLCGSPLLMSGPNALTNVAKGNLQRSPFH